MNVNLFHKINAQLFAKSMPNHLKLRGCLTISENIARERCMFCRTSRYHITRTREHGSVIFFNSMRRS